MRAGLSRHRVTLQNNLIGANNYGEALDYWQDITTVWARVSPSAGRELFSAQQFYHEISQTVTLRYRPDVTPSLRLVFDSRYFEILSVINPDERNRELILACKEWVHA
ncbi:putative phage head-tail adaptor (plasmid) [Piscirickettsia salmonis]|uniref:phage head closure protein n=1 Tax=Piscirickettsia salmonis TaxID=1238 RepID=UPI0012BB0442|nr:phage head closure protein [Piscirickettsia salmonis]QGP56803.1 putative phage head-tail adaptor [Piscirickettsia salmonis]QGP61518.1 putative phage head-tail adaptor [Piscirickettsia salmonis]QGP66374.1 putative phage head-tail adaptor [Piscirickettsia salmonis]